MYVSGKPRKEKLLCKGSDGQGGEIDICKLIIGLKIVLSLVKKKELNTRT